LLNNIVEPIDIIHRRAVIDDASTQPELFVNHLLEKNASPPSLKKSTLN